MYIKMLSKSVVTRIMHIPPEGRVNYHILLKYDIFPVIIVYGIQGRDRRIRLIQKLQR